MSGIYGSMTLYWPEQHVPHTYFDMTPQINDGYSAITVLSSGYTSVRHNDISMVKDGNGNLVRTVRYYIWSIPKLEEGKFVSWQDTLENYRICSSNEWPQPGGFYVYELKRLVGTNGGATVNPGFSDGSNNFA